MVIFTSVSGKMTHTMVKESSFMPTIKDLKVKWPLEKGLEKAASTMRMEESIKDSGKMTCSTAMELNRG